MSECVCVSRSNNAAQRRNGSAGLSTTEIGCRRRRLRHCLASSVCVERERRGAFSFPLSQENNNGSNNNKSTANVHNTRRRRRKVDRGGILQRRRQQQLNHSRVGLIKVPQEGDRERETDFSALGTTCGRLILSSLRRKRVRPFRV